MLTRFNLTRYLPPLILAASLLLAGCRSPQLGQELIQVQVIADGSTRQVEIQAGSTAGQALEAAGLQTSNLDKSDPPSYTVLSNGDVIRLTRVIEEFTTEEVIIPFEQQIARNESPLAAEYFFRVALAVALDCHLVRPDRSRSGAYNRHSHG